MEIEPRAGYDKLAVRRFEFVPLWGMKVFSDFPPTIRKVIHTTNAIESLNYSLRKVRLWHHSYL